VGVADRWGVDVVAALGAHVMGYSAIINIRGEIYRLAGLGC